MPRACWSCDRETGKLEHTTFWQIGEYLRPGDLLVVNQTRVIPARIFARKETGGRVELLLLRRQDELTWEALVGGKRLTAGKRLQVEGGPRRGDDCRPGRLAPPAALRPPRGSQPGAGRADAPAALHPRAAATIRSATRRSMPPARLGRRADRRAALHPRADRAPQGDAG